MLSLRIFCVMLLEGLKLVVPRGQPEPYGCLRESGGADP